MERLFAIADVFTLIGSFSYPDDRFRVALTGLNVGIWQQHFQDRSLMLYLWNAWLDRTPTPRSELGDNFDAPPTPPSDSPVLHSDWPWAYEDRRLGLYDRDPDSPLSDIYAELERQDDCWTC